MTSHALVLNSPGDKDPTRTLTLREKWVSDTNGRFRRLITDIRHAIIDLDVLGLKGRDRLAVNHLPGKHDQKSHGAKASSAPDFAFTPAITAAIQKDIEKRSVMGDAIQSSLHGVVGRAQNPIDTLLDAKWLGPRVEQAAEGKFVPDSLLPPALYGAFAGTRDAIRSEYGDEIRLYRNDLRGKHPEKIANKHTLYWATRSEAKKYGRGADKKKYVLRSQVFKVDDILGAHVITELDGSVGYHEFVMLNRKSKGFIDITKPSAPVVNVSVAPFIVNAAPDPEKFQFRRDDEKIAEFMKWLREQESQDILEIVQGPGATDEPWTDMYVRSSYQRGLNGALANLRAAGIDVPATSLAVRGAEGVTGAFYQPFHVDRLRLISTRTFTDLKGVTETMNTQMARVLTQGILEGVGPEEMARRLVDRVEKIGMTRARLIARTETVETFNRAALGEYQRAGAVIGEEIKVEWWTAEDERVRSSHAARHGKIYTQAQASGMLGSPNCRCAILPYLEG